MISEKLRNLTDSLEAHANAGQLDKPVFEQALSVLRDLASQADAIEHRPAPVFHVQRGETAALLWEMRDTFERYADDGMVLKPPAVQAFVALFESMSIGASEEGLDFGRWGGSGDGAEVIDLAALRSTRVVAECCAGIDVLEPGAPCDVEPPTPGPSDQVQGSSGAGCDPDGSGGAA